jgi:hypothetical protein
MVEYLSSKALPSLFPYRFFRSEEIHEDDSLIKVHPSSLVIKYFLNEFTEFSKKIIDKVMLLHWVWTVLFYEF